MALLAFRSRRLLPALSTIVSRHLTSAAFTRSSPIPTPVSSAASAVAKFQSRSFKSTSASLLSSRQGNRNSWEDEKLDPNEILFEGCDYNHWLITIDFPKDPKPSAEEMVEFYVQTCAKGLNISIEEAKKKIYACSTTTYNGFQAVMTEAESEQFQGLPGVVFILPDSYIDPANKEYGGDKYINGTIIPRPPPIQYKNRRPRYDNQGGQQGNFQNQQRAPMQGDGRNYNPTQNIPQQNYGPPGQMLPPPPGGYPQAGRGGNFNQPGGGNYNAQDRRAPPPPPGGMQNYGPNTGGGYGPGVRGGQGPTQGFGPGGGYGSRQGPNPNQGFPGSGGGYGPGQGPSPGYGPGQGPSPGYGANGGYGPGQGPRQGFGPSAGGGYGQGQVPSQGFGPGGDRGYGPGQVPSQGFGPGGDGGYGPGQGENQGFGPGAGGHTPVQAPNQGVGPGSGDNFGPNSDFRHGNQGRR